MSFQKQLKKIRRNFTDYGLCITVKKSLATLLCSVYENTSYRVYMINLNEHIGLQSKNNNFAFKLINVHDNDLINQIEDIEEWLQDRVKAKVQKGDLCLIALDGQTVAGFNIVSLKDGKMPLVHFKRKLRTHEAWSEQISVHKNYRGQKLASNLRIRMFLLLKERGITKFYGGAQISNTASLNLAKRVGFKEIATIQYKKLFSKKNLHCTRYKA